MAVSKLARAGIAGYHGSLNALWLRPAENLRHWTSVLKTVKPQEAAHNRFLIIRNALSTSYWPQSWRKRVHRRLRPLQDQGLVS